MGYSKFAPGGLDELTDEQHGERGGGDLHAAATGVEAGFMSASDKAALDILVAGRDWLGVHLERAATLSGLTRSKLSYYFNEFERVSTRYDSGASGGANIGSGGATTGYLDCDTGTTAGARWDVYNSQFAVDNIKTVKWYAATRARVFSASDAQTTLRICGCHEDLNNTASFNVINGVLNIELMVGGVKTLTATSWTVENANFHDFALAFNATTVRAYVDGVEVGSTTNLANMPTGDGYPSVQGLNGTTNASRRIWLSKMLLVCEDI